MDNQSNPAPVPTPASCAVHLVRTALKAALATLDGGHPYASLVLVATMPEGSPILLISRLAQHTRNLERDPRASLLFDGTGGTQDALSGPRVSVRGALSPAHEPQALRRFLARHPAARGYAAFPDFSTYRMQMETAHYVGGFGRIVDVPRADLTLPLDGAAPLLEAEAGIVDHMNADHLEAVHLYATRLCAAPPGDWRITGIDPQGIDLVCEPHTARLLFAAPVHTPSDARQVLVALAQEARSRPA